ncbi:MAG: GNAT family N-acetyltransferase [Pseudomonadota bacterium]
MPDRGATTPPAPTIRPYVPTDQDDVSALFTIVNRALAPPDMADAFARYVDQALKDDMGRIPDFYVKPGGGFWVAVDGTRLVGMFGLEKTGDGVMELRRMYVHPDARRRGIARHMLDRAERECARLGAARLTLSTSEVQPAALSLYRRSGYALIREGVVEAPSARSIGGGVRRFYFAKIVGANAT